jgi:hypothetical protein
VPVTQRELRQHLRVRSESRAVLFLAEGAQVRCEVRDLSLGGAYLVRSTQFGPADPLPPGLELGLWIFHPGRGDGFRVRAAVVREEGGGAPGLAVRFLLEAEQAPAVIEHVGWEADREKVPRLALGIPTLRYPQPSFPSVRRVMRAVTAGAAVLGVLILWWILRD